MDCHAYALIPQNLKNSMKAYVKEGKPMCQFLTAIFANDLGSSVAFADDDNLWILPIYVSWIYNKLPIGCHGSYEIVDKWISKMGGKKNEH